jgi:hypothetical protein
VSGARELAALAERAQRDDAVELRPHEPHIAGMAVGLGSFGLGLWAASAGSQALSWAALAGVVLGMVLYLRWRVAGPGWRVDLRARRVEPVGRPGEPVALEGRGWTLRTGPGDHFATVAIDLLHDERGRVARLYEHTALRPRDRRQVSAIADALAARLKIERLGPGARST